MNTPGVGALCVYTIGSKQTSSFTHEGNTKMHAIIKQSVYAGGQSVVVGRYISRDDTLKTMEYIGPTAEADSKIQTMKNAGQEFQHVRIIER